MHGREESDSTEMSSTSGVGDTEVDETTMHVNKLRNRY